jgi:hypothetical protein
VCSCFSLHYIGCARAALIPARKKKARPLKAAPGKIHFLSGVRAVT